MAYDAKAQDFAYSFYARGWSRDRAVAEIRKQYAGFGKSTWDEWERKFDWKARRASAEAKVRALEEDAGDITRAMLLDLNDIRVRLVADLKAKDAPDNQAIYAIASVSKRIADLAKQAVANRDGAKVEMEVIHTAIDALLGNLQAIPGVGAVLKENAAAVGSAVAQIADRFGAQA